MTHTESRMTPLPRALRRYSHQQVVGHRCWCGVTLTVPEIFQARCRDGHTTHDGSDAIAVQGCPPCEEEGREMEAAEAESDPGALHYHGYSCADPICGQLDVESLLREQGAERRALAMETIGAYDVTWAIVEYRFRELREAINIRDWQEVQTQCDLLGKTMTKWHDAS